MKPKNRWLRAVSTLALLSALTIIAIGVRAQGGGRDRVGPPIVVEPPIFWPPRPFPSPILNQELQLISQNADVEIKGATASTKLTQIFQNTTGRRVEGTYIFPLPEGAAVSGFAMTVNGKRMEAEILEGDKARAIYTGIVQKLRDPAILEFIDRNLVQAKIFPIEPGATQTMELEYSESLRPEGSSFRYVVPLRLPLGGSAQKASVNIKISSPDGIKAVYSPTHEIKISRDGDTARVTGEFGNQPRQIIFAGDDTIRSTPRGSNNALGSDRDFVLYYTTSKAKIGVNLVTYKEAEGDGYFMLMVAPDPKLSSQEIAAKDVVFVLDTSGSMEGEKIEQARKALLSLVNNLNPNDRFNIVTFSSDTHDFRDELKTADKSTLDAAREWIGKIKAVGGTNINDALQQAFMLFRMGRIEDESVERAMRRPRQIIFLTDGQPTVGETDVATILKNVRSVNGLVPQDFRQGIPAIAPDYKKFAEARLFIFGVGYDVNTRLLDTLAADNRGSSDYVLPSEDIEQKVGSLYNKIAFPVLSNPRVDWNGMKVFDVYPKNLPDLFKGTQQIVFGRFEGKSTQAAPQLIGLMSGREERIAGDGDFSDDTNLNNRQNDLIARLWATRKIGYLMDEARLQNRTVDGEVKDEIIKLSKKFGIVTPFTAALIAEDGDRVLPPQSVPMGAGGAPTFSRKAANGAFAAGAMEDSGQDAVLASRARRDMKDAQTVQNALPSQNAKTLEGKTFVLQNGVWTDADYDATKNLKVETVKFASSEYFALLKDKRVAKWLSVGEKLLVVIDGRAIQIEP